jgi:hypothetical protein
MPACKVAIRGVSRGNVVGTECLIIIQEVRRYRLPVNLDGLRIEG